MDEEIEKCTENILKSIYEGNIKAYKNLARNDLTSFEPETLGSLVQGLSFHLFLMENEKFPKLRYEVINPIYRTFGDFAYAAYTLLITKIVDDQVTFSKINETRIFCKENGCWKMVHFHRSKG